MKYVTVLLALVPVAIVGSLLHWDDRLVFFGAALGIVPLAWVLGKATEELAARIGPRVGGLLNATLGNASELIITIFAVREGLLELVKASITGSIRGTCCRCWVQASWWADCATGPSASIALKQD